jgi:hypothetical protein
MNSSSRNASVHNSISGAGSGDATDVDATLRLVARLPAPEGLEDRVLARLKTAPRTGRILHWPAMMQPGGGWMRGAAAAAIVFVVAGGGWGIYTHVQPTQPARVIVMPPRAGAAGGFSNAGAMRTPQTLNGPVVVQPSDSRVVTAPTPKTKALKKAPARIGTAPVHGPQATANSKTAAQPAEPPAR